MYLRLTFGVLNVYGTLPTMYGVLTVYVPADLWSPDFVGMEPLPTCMGPLQPTFEVLTEYVHTSRYSQTIGPTWAMPGPRLGHAQPIRPARLTG